MTLLKPTISLRRLCVFKDERTVFDAGFHSGVNIIHGHNSSGKTTVLDFAAYALGAEYIPWKQEALLCDWTIAEVLLNGKAITIRRAVNTSPMNPMYIFWGIYDDAMNASVMDWQVFGFKRSASKLSFTQALLLSLELAEAQGDGASNLTMHQLLRVLYADQPSLHSPIFRSDTFDSALNRETIGSYLTGIYDDKLYVAQLEKRRLEKEIAKLEAELKSIFTVLAKSERNVNFEFLGTEIVNLEAQKVLISEELARLRSERTVTAQAKKANSDLQLRSLLDTAKIKFFNIRDNIAHGELDVADSKRFVEELELRLRSLDESGAARNYFGNLSFSFCPCCLTEVKAISDKENDCALCKSSLNSKAADSQLLRMRNELRIQLSESQGLIAEREAELRKWHTQLPAFKQELKALENRYNQSTQTWSSDLETAIEAVARKSGSIEQEIKGLYENQRLAESIRQLQERRNAFDLELVAVESTIESLGYSQETRKQVVQLEVAQTLGRLLREDLNRQAEFQKADNIQFSFTDNIVAVEGATQFSESSTVVLRHLFHLALLSASTRIPEMRLPRFLMLDGIEDGGMELEVLRKEDAAQPA